MSNNLPDIWNKIVDYLKSQLSTPGFKTFLSSTKPLAFNEGIILIGVPNEYTKNWIKERCEILIKEFLKNSLKQHILIDYKLTGEEPAVEIPQEGHELSPDISVGKKDDLIPALAGAYLNPKYTFESFVVGHNNRFAHAAALAVSETPAKAYNPLFIYGGVGLGKTHLMQAIGHKALQINPKLKVLYVTSEQFTNELINSIRDDKNEEFRGRYRKIDILLVDDIQFIAGKDRTQEEFFHTFNALHETNKQIVLSSDRPPHDLHVEDRLRTRFAWGLSADIKPPELETRIAILRKKADGESLNLPDEVLHYIAAQIPSNIRDLEGALIKIVAYSSLVNSELSVELAADVIKDIVSPHRDKPITISTIKKAVAEYFKLEPDILSAKLRTKDVAHARQTAMYLARELTTSSLPKIGENFGGRDHTTVMHAYDKIKEEMEKDSQVNDQVKSIMNNISKVDA
ncbi:chromosomal replication initiator protein DnaA [Candidatus Margulisiibacteriota bacterium]